MERITKSIKENLSQLALELVPGALQQIHGCVEFTDHQALT